MLTLKCLSFVVCLCVCVCVSQFWDLLIFTTIAIKRRRPEVEGLFRNEGDYQEPSHCFHFLQLSAEDTVENVWVPPQFLGTNELDAGQLRGILPMFITFAHLRPSSRSAIFWMLVISVAGPWPRGNDQNPMFDDPGNHVKLRDERWHVYKICMHILMCRKLCARQFFGLCITIICTTSVFTKIYIYI